MVGVRWFQDRFQGKRVCILDWDVHYGDGTASLVNEDPSVLYISLHWFDDGNFYPGVSGDYKNIGKGKG